MNGSAGATEAGEGLWIRVLLIATVALVFAGQFNHDLWTPDEPRVAAIMTEMAHTSEYVVPHLGGEPFVEKPPLYFALGALFDRAFGGIIGNLPALRLLNAALALGTLAFLYLLALRLYERRVASWAVIVLGSSVGFASNSFWLRVDVGLAFFTTAAIWAFCEGYLGRRPGAIVGAGALTAGAFLVKGPIGLAMIFFPWLVLLVWSCLPRGTGWHGRRSFWIAHAVSLGCLAIPSATWMVALRLQPDGARLWREWFWQNQFGRFIGTAGELGHISPEPLYYAGPLALYLLPWLPFVVRRAWRDILGLLRTRRFSLGGALCWVWASGVLILLSSSTTKRTVYLLPLLPAFALMAASAAVAPTLRGLRLYAWAWVVLGLGASVLAGTSPLFASRLPDTLPDPMRAELSAMDLWKLSAWVAAALVAWAVHRSRAVGRSAVTLALGYALLSWVLLTVAVPVIDRTKSMSDETRGFIAAIPRGQRARVAAFNFGETERAIFYFYGRWPVARLSDPAQVVAILEGRDARYDSVIVNWDREPGDLFATTEPPPAYRVLAEAHPRQERGDGLGIYWLTGTPLTSTRPPGRLVPRDASDCRSASLPPAPGRASVPRGDPSRRSLTRGPPWPDRRAAASSDVREPPIRGAPAADVQRRHVTTGESGCSLVGSYPIDERREVARSLVGDVGQCPLVDLVSG